MNRVSKAEILAAFSRKNQKKVKISFDPDKLEWENLDFLGWIHPSGHLGYIVFEKDNELKGVVMDKNKPSSKHKGAMCNWCMTVHNSSGTALFSVRLPSKAYNSVGTYICADLQCSLNIRGLKPLSPNQMRETLSVEDKIIRLMINMEKFLEKTS